MTNVIVAFSKPEDGKNIKKILARSGFPVNAVCTAGAQALNFAENLGGGIIVSGYRLTDMIYFQLKECLPPNFDFLLIASPRRFGDSMPPDLVCLSMPFKVQDLADTVEMMSNAQARRRKKLKSKPKERSEEEKKLISQAKLLLMERNNMTEEKAHRYIQKCSMDSGMNLLETAQMIISLMNV